MPREQLDNFVRIGQLQAESRSEQEVAGLVKSGLARLKDSKIEPLSTESRFDLAYNAAHALSLAALRQAGCRSGSRCLVFQSLKHTIALDDGQWRVLDHAHRKRNIAEYEGELDIDQGLLEALIRTAEVVAKRVQQR